MIEAIEVCEKLTGKKMNYQYADANLLVTIYVHIDVSKFKKHYPTWNYNTPSSYHGSDI